MAKEKFCATCEGRAKNKVTSEKIREEKRANKLERIMNLPFPPEISDIDEKRCINDFINATSPESMETVECGICGEAVRNRDVGNKAYPLHDIPGRELLLLEHQENQEFIDEYVFDDLLLSPGGVQDDQSVLCCKTCLTSLCNGKLPKYSIANGFQIGKTPPVLSGLTLSEKLLISKCRPKMYVVKLRASGGPQTQQRGLKGNTITFPQDVVKVASSLPANPGILVDHLKIVFIGRGKPTRAMLKKVFTVRREKVHNALNFLIENNPVYADVRLSNAVNLPVDDLPKEIMDILEVHDDENDEDANEHSTYTPQTDLNDIPSDTIVMDSVGMVDLEGSNVNSSEQMNSAILELQGNRSSNLTNSVSLQGTMIVPHGSVPVNEYNNPNLWLGAYPWLFPYGRGGPETSRKVNVGLRAYIKHLLKLADRKFSLDLSLKFHAFNVIQKRDVSYHTSLFIRRPGFNTTATRIDSLNQESMSELLKCVENKSPITDPNLRSLMNSLSSAGKHINGSPYQKSTYRREIFGLMIQEGSPVLWITLSPAVIHSPIFLQIAGYNVDLSLIPSQVERAQLVANDPVAAAIYFNEIIDAFTQYLLGHRNHDGGIFGHPSAYYGMTEEQGTGTLHNHMLVWLHNFKSVSMLKAKLEDETFKNNLISYLERIIKQGYLDDDNVEEDIDVSEVSCKYPVDPNHENFEEKFKDDVNKLVKVANTHSCRSTCYKYRRTKECRFEFPRELVPKGKIEGNEIKLTRTNEMINNYNPSIMTCIRSNHDIKFIPSGKDGKNIAFYVTNYATKSQLSTNQMVPLIAAAKKRLEVDPSNALNDVKLRTKAMITKCLNRITTETEISGSHVSHFLLGHKDNKTSHKFTGLNLHVALAWLRDEIKKYDELNQAVALTEEENHNEAINNDRSNSVNHEVINEIVNDVDDDSEDNDKNTSYSISTGNDGLVFVNQMTDYLNRGEALNFMCLWEYCSKVYKKKFTAEDLKKHEEKDKIKKSKRECEQVYQFSTNHPQSKTHWQKVRIKGSALVPTLSKLPPSSKDDKTKYQKCILLLFKPFTFFEELFTGITWDETYSNFLEITEYTQNIANIDELHKGIEEKREKSYDDESDINVDEIVDDECDDDTDQLEETDTGLDMGISEALDIIKNTPWLNESISNRRNVQSMQPEFQNSSRPPVINNWEEDLKKQNQDIVDNVKPDECRIQSETQFIATFDDNAVDIDFSTERCSPIIQEETDPIEKIKYDTIRQFELNRKQKKAFEMAIENVIKRYEKQATEQLIGYIGGPGGTGKSQVIKAIVHFHNKIKAKNTLKLCANTGTAAKHIGGSTTSTLFGFGPKKDLLKIQRKFENVKTIIVDEVSMIGCRQLAKIANALCKAKCAGSSLPFGNIDIIFFGDFIQFRPVKDTPLYSAWKTEKYVVKRTQSDINKELGMHLWRQINHIVLLDEQMRVQDKNYLALLNRLREGKCTNSDVDMLNRRVVGQTVDITSSSDAPIITPGNQLVMAINDLFVASHSQSTKVYVSTAKDFIGKKMKLPNIVSNKIKQWANTATQGLPRELQLYVGMPVMVTKNIATALGITNGTTGVVKSLHFKSGEVVNEDTGLHHFELNNADYIIVELDDINVKPLDNLPPNHVPIFPKKEYFSVYIPGKKTPFTVNRTHFPLVPRFSCTAHKSQGQTLSKAIVDLVPHSRMKKVEIEFSYVPLSRIRKLEDLTILRPFDPSVLKAQVNQEYAAMMKEFKEKDLCKDM